MGCYRAAYRTGKPPNGQVHTQWNHFFLWGVVNTAKVDVTAVCEHGMSELIIRKSVANWFASTLTLGLYSPRIAIIHCAAEAARPAPPEEPYGPPTPAAPPAAPATAPPVAGGGTP
jgi:hypothetical protein